MTKLYEKRLADSMKLPYSGQIASETPGRLAAVLAAGLCADFDLRPSVFSGSRFVTLLLRGVGFACGDFARQYGEVLALLSGSWPAAAYGTVCSGETGEISARLQDGKVLIELRCVSGKRFEMLSDLCVRIQCGDERQAAALSALLSRIRPGRGCVALPRQYEDFYCEQGLADPMPGALFCYCPLDGEAEASACLDGLSIGQKAALWRTFLEDGVCSREFEWLYALYEQDEAVHLLEWEVALQSVLEALGFQIVNQTGAFDIQDAQGARRRFHYENGSPAEKMFLKILFPIRLEW